ncbi:MAG: type III-A CRISPR-associated protein Csm2 [Desulfobacterales bacterium]|nr:type III-A CRISPR-associated protein Csm2 [Desulfobacterales bacterium]
MNKPTAKEIREIIGGDARLLVEKANSFAVDICHKVSASQLRNAFGTMKRLQMLGWKNAKVPAQLLLMKPRLAYMAGRHKATKDVKDVLIQGIDCVKDEKTFESFCNFFEAILAYHKAHGGKS